MFIHIQPLCLGPSEIPVVSQEFRIPWFRFSPDPDSENDSMVFSGGLMLYQRITDQLIVMLEARCLRPDARCLRHA